ncbi:yellowish-green 1-like protein [Lasiosphaeria miniovina]|uniref:Yellowish-green 1-like protein n=1 Tax=Lasiosphaeria miniovina TaxID=1954250 RepID=A0AA40ACW3_9PEZI|nr:yellowish-green 1-like protein [Lasiosphaeria miniovina]KAK0713520.1 yellowish-green 1-like protein [Lasiosphaeria miniovina]
MGSVAKHHFYIEDALLRPAVHHQSFEKLWETKWKTPCQMGIYPFMFGSIVDFEPVARAIIDKGLKEPYDWDEYAQMFSPKAQELARIAEEAERLGQKDKACEYYLRSSAVYRIARFPAPRSQQQRLAWKAGKEVFYKGAALMEHPIKEVLIPHAHRVDGEGDVIPVNFLVPPSASAASPCPLLIIFTGLDGYRTELAVWQRGWLDKGVATVVVEIPGTGDSPALASDPKSPDRQWSSVLDWVATQHEVDVQKVVVWGFSTGGYYSLRVAHTHASRLLASVSLGGGAHHMFDAAWLRRVNALEYPFDLADTLAHKFGYADLDTFVGEAGKFSLLDDGTLDGRAGCCRVLLVNGNDDEIFPIDDLFVALEHGAPKEARMVRGKKHMGEPDSFVVILQWIHALLGLDADIMHQLRLLPSKTRF